jgi:hypothetical protein
MSTRSSTGTRFAFIATAGLACAGACAAGDRPAPSTPVPAQAPPVPVFELLCGSSATVCTPDDRLRIIVKGMPDAAAAESVWNKGVDVSIVGRDDGEGTQSLSGVLREPEKFGTEGARQVDLHPLIDPVNAQDETLLNVLYRQAVAQIPLAALIRQPGQTPQRIPFTLDLTASYRSGALGLMLSRSKLPYCIESGAAQSTCDTGSTFVKFWPATRRPQLVVTIENLRQWEMATNHPYSALVLYLNDVPMTGLVASQHLSDPSGVQSLSYPLTRNLASKDNAQAWQALLATQDGSLIMATVAIGVDGAHWTAPQSITLEIPRYPGIPIAIGVLALLILVLLGFNKPFAGTFRASPGVPCSLDAFQRCGKRQADLEKLQEKITLRSFDPPFSLSKVLMAMWLVLVFFSFVALYLLTADGVDLINTTALALLGFGGASLVAARAIDARTDADIKTDQKLGAALTAFNPAVPQTKDELVLAFLAARNSGLVTSGRFSYDLLSESGAPRFDLHRLQLAAFTAFYVLVFLWTLNDALTLPDFSSNTLTLIGISTASYIGFKYSAAQ